MNNYFKNQIRRANCALTTKLAAFVVALLQPRKIWREHVDSLQRELDAEHDGRLYSEPYLELHPSRCRPAGYVPFLQNPQAWDPDYRAL